MKKKFFPIILWLHPVVIFCYCCFYLFYSSDNLQFNFHFCPFLFVNNFEFIPILLIL